MAGEKAFTCQSSSSIHTASTHCKIGQRNDYHTREQWGGCEPGVWGRCRVIGTTNIYTVDWKQMQERSFDSDLSSLPAVVLLLLLLLLHFVLFVVKNRMENVHELFTLEWYSNSNDTNIPISLLSYCPGSRLLMSPVYHRLLAASELNALQLGERRTTVGGGGMVSASTKRLWVANSNMCECALELKFN